MREIQIDLSSDYYLQQPKVFGGYVGEHNESKLVVKLPNRMIRDDISYYYFEFQTVLGEHITSPNVYKNTSSTDNEISIVLWEQLSPAAGNLKFCVNAIELGENGAITIKGKTSVCTLYISESPTGKDVLIDSNTSKEELQKSIDSALKKAKDSGEFKGEKGDPGEVTTDYANATFANAPKGSKSGASFLIDDISPVEHNMTVKIRSKNILPLADSGIFYNGSIYGGSPYIYNQSYLITDFNNINISANRGVYAVIRLTEEETYTLTINNLVNNCATKQIKLAVGFRSSESTVFGTSETSKTAISGYNSSSLTFTVPSGYPYCLVGFFNYPTASGDTVSFDAMQLEIGGEATAYTEYIRDFTSVTVIKSDVSDNVAARYTPNSDGTVEGVSSIYPDTLLTTDTDGVIIDCEYNRDINKAFAKLQQAIISLGGNV